MMARLGGLNSDGMEVCKYPPLIYDRHLRRGGMKNTTVSLERSGDEDCVGKRRELVSTSVLQVVSKH